MPGGVDSTASRVGQRHRAALLAAAVLIAGAGAATALVLAYGQPPVAHDPMHVNCPPGSHKSWSADHARSFNVPRRQRATPVDAGEEALRERGLTAGRTTAP